ncbi:transposase [Mesorhizobium sp. M1334]|uniref:IS4/Tn5 family transposase DNA-binding protein n=1 Tax=Mesorhizobium sp. M1334 TaxID=2957084 RepID=UPI003339FB14
MKTNRRRHGCETRPAAAKPLGRKSFARRALPDKRLVRRLQRLLDQLSAAPGKPIPAACSDWAAAKAAYRFFDNPRVTEHSVLAGHFAANAARVAANEVRSLFCRTRPNLSTAARSRVNRLPLD